MKHILASPEAFTRLLEGKYSRWVEDIDEGALEAMLAAVGEFGVQYWALRTSDGRFPTLGFATRGVSKSRMQRALECFAIVRSEGRIEAKMPSGWHLHFSSSAPAFSPEFSSILSRNQYTAWASDLDERSFALVVWQIGEFGIRANSTGDKMGSERTPPSFDVPGPDTRVMRAALGLIAMLESGVCVTPDQAARILSGAPFPEGPER